MSSQVRIHRGWSALHVATLLAGITCLAPVARSQMLDPVLTAQYTQLELRMAQAVQALGDARNTTCPNGCPTPEIDTLYDNIVFPLFGSAAAAASSGGTPEMQALKNGLRRLGPEELFALGPIAIGFAQGQLNTLENRIGAIRSLSRAQLFARNVVGDELKYGYAAADGIPAGAAGANFSRLNYFLDTSVGFGSRGDTTGFGGTDTVTGTEAAFDFDSNELTLGVDWRFSDNLVVGGLLGYSDRKLKFDPGESLAQGRVSGDGLSLIGFAQWDDFRWYGSFGLGFQKLGFKSLRRVPLGSASDDPPPDVVGASGKPDSTALLASLNAGLPFQKGPWGADLYFNAAFQRQSIDRFTERQVDDGGAVETTGFLFHTGRQNIRSFDTSLGVKLQYVATPSFGVVIPFVRAAFHRELETSRRKLQLEFVGLEGLPEAQQDAIEAAFQVPLPSDRPDKSWIGVTAGASAVIRGSSRVSAAGRSGGGLQAYLQYMTNIGLAHYDSDAISAGLRYEF